jgi:hypothetical protein
LGVVDLPSFKIIKPGWAKDDEAYYAVPQFAPIRKVECDYPTMRILNGQYAVDRNRAYYYGNPIQGADAETFRVTGDTTARDAHNKYRGDRLDWLK